MFQKDRINYIPIDNVNVNPNQPRRIFNEEHLETLSQSISRYGLLQPISVRKIGWDQYELIAGERRLRACKKIEMKKIPAIVIDVPDEKSAELALIENLQRQDLNYFEEAEAYEKLIERFHITQKELAERVGKSQSSIANKLRLLHLDQRAKETILLHDLSERHARSLLKLKEYDRQELVLEKIVKNMWTVKETENFVDKMVHQEPKNKKQKIKFKIPEQMLLNTIKEAVKTIEKSGTEVRYQEEIRDDAIHVTLQILRK